MSDAAAKEKMRIDKWLWHARFFKTRGLASEVAASGHLRVNRQPIHKSSHGVGPGDVLTFSQGDIVRVIEIVALSQRRGPASEARDLYDDLSPPTARPKSDKPPTVAPRADGAGRPTKKERRQTDKLREAEP